MAAFAARTADKNPNGYPNRRKTVSCNVLSRLKSSYFAFLLCTSFVLYKYFFLSLQATEGNYVRVKTAV